MRFQVLPRPHPNGMTHAMARDQLARARDLFNEANALYRPAVEARQRAVWQAWEAGMTDQQIGEVVGVTRWMVAKIRTRWVERGMASYD